MAKLADSDSIFADKERLLIDEIYDLVESTKSFNHGYFWYN